MAPAQLLLAGNGSLNKSNIYVGDTQLYKVTKQRDKIFQIDYEEASK